MSYFKIQNFIFPSSHIFDSFSLVPLFSGIDLLNLNYLKKNNSTSQMIRKSIYLVKILIIITIINFIISMMILMCQCVCAYVGRYFFLRKDTHTHEQQLLKKLRILIIRQMSKVD